MSDTKDNELHYGGFAILLGLHAPDIPHGPTLVWILAILLIGTAWVSLENRRGKIYYASLLAYGFSVAVYAFGYSVRATFF